MVEERVTEEEEGSAVRNGAGEEYKVAKEKREGEEESVCDCKRSRGGSR